MTSSENGCGYGKVSTSIYQTPTPSDDCGRNIPNPNRSDPRRRTEHEKSTGAMPGLRTDADFGTHKNADCLVVSGVPRCPAAEGT